VIIQLALYTLTLAEPHTDFSVVEFVTHWTYCAK